MLTQHAQVSVEYLNTLSQNSNISQVISGISKPMIACWYSFECISHGDSKYGYEIPQF